MSTPNSSHTTNIVLNSEELCVTAVYLLIQFYFYESYVINISQGRRHQFSHHHHKLVTMTLLLTSLPTSLPTPLLIPLLTPLLAPLLLHSLLMWRW